MSRKDFQAIPLFEGEEELEQLDLSYNTIKKLENLISLPKLSVLNLAHNKITTMTNMNTLQQLKALDLSYNCISHIEGLDYLKALEILNLEANCISKVTGISHLLKLSVLKLSENKITALEFPSTLSSLKELYASHNEISSINKLELLGQLEVLDVSYNKIKNYDNKLKSLKTFLIDHNPCTESQDNEMCDKEMPFKNISNTPNYGKSTVKDYTEEQVKLIEKIRHEWKFEHLLVKSGDMAFLAVIENGTTLHLFGVSALDYLTTAEYKTSITEIIFECIRFEHVVYPPVLNELKKYTQLNSIVLINNNLSSFVLLSKLEPLGQVKKLTIKQNTICKLTTFEAFVAYRFQHLIELNGKGMTKELRAIAKEQFERFDRALPAATLANKRHLCYKKLGYSKAAIKTFSKECEMVSHQFCKKIKNESEICYERRRMAEKGINYCMSDIIHEYTEKLQHGIATSEETLNSYK